MLNKSNELSINIQSENIIANILNTVYNYDLENANVVLGKNAAAVDLLDFEQSVAFQITANNTSEKIHSTVKKFLDSQLSVSIKHLYIFLLSDKRNYRQDKINDIIAAEKRKKPELNNFKFEVTKQVLDINDLYHEISNITDLDKVKRVKNKLDQELEELAIIFSTISTRRTQVFFSFADQDYPLAKAIIPKLINNQITILHQSEKINEDPTFSEAKGTKLIFVESEHLPNCQARYCIALFTKNYEMKWNRFSKCPMLEQSIRKQDMIFSYRIGSGSFKYLEIISLPEPPLLYSEFETGHIQDDVIQKIKIYQPIDYKDFLRILQMSDAQSEFRLVEQVKNFGFNIYEKKDKITGDDFHFVCFYKNALQESSFNYISEKYKSILNSGRFSILLIKEPGQQDPEKRKENFNKLFKPRKIWYVDEFVFLFCTPFQFREQIDMPEKDSHFVMPYLVDQKNAHVSLEDLKVWLSHEKPILVMKGSGGIGKTTLALQMQRLYLESKPNAKSIFIESGSLINPLRQRRVSDFYSLYDLSWGDNEGKLSREQFRLNFDNGNLMMIIDGIDELIAKVSSFEIDLFLETVKDFTNELRNGKIIITCRDYFWKTAKEDLRVIQTVEIRPFNIDLAEEFFDKRHPGSKPLVKKCMKLAKSVVGNQANENKIEFIPFVLDVVDNQINYTISDNDFEEETGQVEFNSEILNKNSPSDFILYNICNREFIRLGQEPVDTQIQLFIELSLNLKAQNDNGTFATRSREISDAQNNIPKEKFKAIFEEKLPDLSSDTFETFLGHPILLVSEGRLFFKYDFFAEFFSNVYVGLFIKGDLSSQDRRLIKIIANYGKYNSNFSHEIALRLETLSDKYLTNIIDLIDIIKKDLETDENLIRKAVCGLFMIALRIKYLNNLPDKETNTSILTDLFGKRQIKDLYLIDIYDTDQKNQILLDFSNLKIERAIVDNYDFFWKCTFNDNTSFINSTFRHLTDRYFRQTTAARKNFDRSCTFSLEFNELWRERNIGEKNINASIVKEFRQFLGIFKQHGHIRPMSIKKYIERDYVGRLVKLKDMIAFGKEVGILSQTGEPGDLDKLLITESYGVPVKKYLQEGTVTPELNQIIKKLVERMAKS